MRCNSVQAAVSHDSPRKLKCLLWATDGRVNCLGVILLLCCSCLLSTRISSFLWATLDLDMDILLANIVYKHFKRCPFLHNLSIFFAFFLLSEHILMASLRVRAYTLHTYLNCCCICYYCPNFINFFQHFLFIPPFASASPASSQLSITVAFVVGVATTIRDYLFSKWNFIMTVIQLVE